MRASCSGAVKVRTGSASDRGPMRSSAMMLCASAATVVTVGAAPGTSRATRDCHARAETRSAVTASTRAEPRRTAHRALAWTMATVFPVPAGPSRMVDLSTSTTDCCARSSRQPGSRGSDGRTGPPSAPG